MLLFPAVAVLTLYVCSVEAELLSLVAVLNAHLWRVEVLVFILTGSCPHTTLLKGGLE